MKDKTRFTNKCDYSAKELAEMSERKREIANMTVTEWCNEWDKLTLRIRALRAVEIAAVKRRKAERG